MNGSVMLQEHRQLGSAEEELGGPVVHSGIGSCGGKGQLRRTGQRAPAASIIWSLGERDMSRKEHQARDDSHAVQFHARPHDGGV